MKKSQSFKVGDQVVVIPKHSCYPLTQNTVYEVEAVCDTDNTITINGWSYVKDRFKHVNNNTPSKTIQKFKAGDQVVCIPLTQTIRNEIKEGEVYTVEDVFTNYFGYEMVKIDGHYYNQNRFELFILDMIKAGDHVKCINDQDLISLKDGDIYVVEEVHGAESFRINELLYFQDRFVFHSRPTSIAQSENAENEVKKSEQYHYFIFMFVKGEQKNTGAESAEGTYLSFTNEKAWRDNIASLVQHCPSVVFHAGRAEHAQVTSEVKTKVSFFI